MNSAIDKNRVKVAIDWIKNLANGINPIDGSVVSDSDIVNNVHISRCLFYVADLLEEAELQKTSLDKQYVKKFCLSPEDIARVFITEKSTISVFVREINKVIPGNMKSLAASSVTNWLVKIGYLDEILKDDGHKTRIPSDRGKSIGITSEQKIGPNGEYTSIIYDANAQRFILDNLFKE
jgi:hypothetical protein